MCCLPVCLVNSPGYSCVVEATTVTRCVARCEGEGFHRAWLHFRRARVGGSVFSAAVCKIQASKHYVESVSLD